VCVLSGQSDGTITSRALGDCNTSVMAVRGGEVRG
jgi:hypothetical protein